MFSRTADQQGWQQLTADIAASLLPVGFDIVHAFPVQLLNTESPPHNQLPAFGRNCTLAVIIGNSKHLWEPFLHWLAGNTALLASSDPLDEYTELHIHQALQQCCSEQQQQQQQQHSPAGTHQSSQQPQHSIEYEVRFAHDTGPKFVNMLRAAQLSGLAYYSSTTHLCSHPVWGSWFALRAVAVIDLQGPDPSAFAQLPCLYPHLEAESALVVEQLQAKGGLNKWKQHWRDWARLRSLGGKYSDSRHAYSSEQLEYHYTKSRNVLIAAVNKLRQTEQESQQQAVGRDHAR